jgi:hypothetical protein
MALRHDWRTAHTSGGIGSFVVSSMTAAMSSITHERCP